MLSLADLMPAPPARSPTSAATSRIRSARSRNRGAAWAHDLAQWRAYQLARTPERSVSIEAEYEQLAASGPDFAGYHVGSSFVEAPLHQMNREDRIKALAHFDALRAGLYRHCRASRGQAVSYNYRHVYGVLLSYAVKRGRVFPSLETIAAAAMCSRTTVLRAIAWLRLFGLLQRIRRLTRERTALGSVRVRQTSNAYRLNTTLAGLSSIALAVFRGGPSVTTHLHQSTQSHSNQRGRGSGGDLLQRIEAARERQAKTSSAAPGDGFSFDAILRRRLASGQGRL